MKQLYELKDILKQKGVISEDIENLIKNLEVEIKKSSYGIVWETQPEDKAEELKNKFPVLTRHREIKNDDAYQNHILIEGDNLYALTAMQYTHIDEYGKGIVDVIYIDPPYNLGKKDFKYNDTFVNPDDQWKHSKWLSFMNKRLKLAYNLLSDNGLIMISINEIEQAHLKLLLDKIFGEENMLSVHHIKSRYESKDVSNGSDWLPVMEYVLIYAKNKSLFNLNKSTEDYDISNYTFSIEEVKSDGFISIDNKKVEIFKAGNYKINKHEECNTNLFKEVWGSGVLVKQKHTAAWYFDKHLIGRLKDDGVDTLYKIYDIGKDGYGYRYIKSPSKLNNKRGKIYQGMPLDKSESIKNSGVAKKYKQIVNYYDYSADFGNISSEGGVPFNDGKKPIKMLKELINYHPNKNAIVLDFFAGSGSTGHAVLDLNKNDNGNRQFILCTNNEVDWDTEIEYLINNNYINEKPKNKKSKEYKLWESKLDSFLLTEEYKNIKNEEEYKKLGICQSITIKRLDNIMNKNSKYTNKNSKYTNNNLIYLKTKLDVEESSFKEIMLKRTITEFMEYVSLKEQCYRINEDTNEYIVYVNESENCYIMVYKEPFATDEKIKSKAYDVLTPYKNNKVFKVYSVIKEKSIINNIQFIPYPQEIIDTIKNARMEV